MVSGMVLMGRSHTRVAYLLLIPSLASLGYLLWWPILQGIGFSLHSYVLTAAEPAQFIGLSNFRRIFQDASFLAGLRNTGIWTASVLAGEMIVGVLAGLALNRPLPARGVLRALFLSAWAMPPVAASVTWKWLYEEQYGLANFVMRTLGLEPVRWLSDPQIALWSVSLVGIWRGAPFVALMTLAGLQAVPRQLVEAARVDGATSLSVLRHVLLPLLRPVLTATALLSFIWTWNTFDITWIMTRGGPAGTTTLLANYLYLMGFRFFDLGYGSAIGVIMILILLVVTAGYLRVTRNV